MRLLFFSNTLNGGGAERVLANLTNELVNRGHEITIALNENQIAYKIDSRVRIVAAPQKKWYQGPNPVKRILRNISLGLRNYKHTKNTINGNKPDVIITFLRCNMWAIIRCHGKTPIIHSEHNAYDRKLGFDFYFNRFFLNRFFTKVCVLTHFDQGYAAAKGIKNTVVMPNPNTFEPLALDEYEKDFANRKNILACGRINFWHVKGFDIAIRVFAKVAERIPDVDLDIAGSGDEASINCLKDNAKKLGVEKRVHFLGQCQDIDKVYRSHKLFILSSRTEGFPMVVSEAMTQGTPCVSFERLSAPIIINGIDGALVKDMDVDEMKDAIYMLLFNEEVRYSFGREAIKNIDRFSSKTIASNWEKLISSLLVNC